jgi:hypothetical protein
VAGESVGPSTAVINFDLKVLHLASERAKAKIRIN